MKKNIAVFFGGRSTEHDVSIITAINSVIRPLKLINEYHVIPIYISRTGEWYSDDKLTDIELYRNNQIEDFCKENRPVSLIFEHGLTIVKQSLLPKKIKIDVAFPAMHGTYGEDGSLMGLLRMADIPYTGCDMQASVIAMDKVLAKNLVRSKGILTAPDVVFNAEEFKNKQKNIIKVIEEKLGYPVFVKPPHLGSSIGVTKANNRVELINAIEVALFYDSYVLIEQSIRNLREVTLPIMGFGNNIITASLEEPLYSVVNDKFFDFSTKYIKNNSGKSGKGKTGNNSYSKIPAELPESLYKKAVENAILAYQTIGCNGIARIDLLIDEKEKNVYFMEANPLPGDLYVHNWIASGVSAVELVEKLIKFANLRYLEERRTETVFASSFLRQF